jgi:periplasmic protein CpxP/Spy
MKPVFKPLLLVGLLSALAAVSQAQPMPGAGTGAGPGGAAPSPEMRAQHMKKMQDHWAQRQADLKAKLKLAPEQEGAWTSFTTTMKPPANLQRPNRAEMEQLNTPARLDKMQALRAQHNAAMDQRNAAIRTFYATLNPEQQKVFDAQTRRADYPMMDHHRGEQRK